MTNSLITDAEIADVLAWAQLEYGGDGDTDAYDGRTKEAIVALLATQLERARASDSS